MIGWNSRKEPGQPWRRRMGMASLRKEKRPVKWIDRVSAAEVSGILKLGKAFIVASVSRLEVLVFVLSLVGE